MAYSYVQYTGNGATVLFSIPFQYIAADYLEVRVNGVLTTAYTLPTAASLQMNVAPANGALLEIRRNTPKTSRLVDFQDASILTEASLDLNSDQTFHITQEAFDYSEDVIGLGGAEDYAAKSWAIYDGTADVLNGSFGIASVTKTSTGIYQFFFTTPFADTNYVAVVSSNLLFGSTAIQAKAVDSVTVRLTSINHVASGAAIDVSDVNLVVFG